ncbi:MAG: FAD-binding oxidoreductase [Dehalococcoidales bacterium]|jgi:FAD/FMN-containing dehydrogenase|nr:FAD-binding oxidoreductase [Dehalococcoidales bacterium]|tara:strand:+ start:118 stop:1581 length:1464 start_codon:yes stop_codon:yes gene_type:complete
MTPEAELTTIIGEENASHDPKTLESYSRDMSFALPITPRCVLRPRNTGEVQEIVRLANRELTPVTAVSSPDGPRFHGDTIPSPGGVVVDLSGMNKVSEVDRRNKLVHLEPGVTFGQLRTELKKSGLKPLIPLMPRHTKSVLASYLEKDPLLMPRHHWDTLDPLLTMEVVFGTGDVMRTGSASGPGTIEELKAAGVSFSSMMGPGQMDFGRIIQGAQGTMGITTWATCACGLSPTVQQPYFVTSEKLEDLIGFMYELLRIRFGEELFLLNNVALANMMGDNAQDIKALSSELPPWVVFVNIAGFEYRPEERVAYQEEDIREFAKQHESKLHDSVAGISALGFLNRLEESQEGTYWKLKAKGGSEDIFFLTTLDRTPEFVNAMNAQAESRKYPSTDIGVYIQPTVQGCSCHCEFILSYDPSDSDELGKVRELVTEGSGALADMGGFFYRPYGPWADLAFGRDPESTALLRKVKDIFDPNNILNPGKLCF